MATGRDRRWARNVDSRAQVRLRNEEIVRRRRSGETYTSIARGLGLSPSRVRQVASGEGER
jgi:DNA-binding CsgD family transcriptional regulator